MPWLIRAIATTRSQEIIMKRSSRRSFAVMERLGEHEAFAFDEHFRVYRFGPGRKRTFTVFP